MLRWKSYFKKAHYGEFKQAVADIIWKTLEPIQQRYQILLQGDKILTTIKKNTVLVNEIANKKIAPSANADGLNNLI